jgi:hypothetical protein
MVKKNVAPAELPEAPAAKVLAPAAPPPSPPSPAKVIGVQIGGLITQCHAAGIKRQVVDHLEEALAQLSK